MPRKKIIISAVILILLTAAGCIAWRCRYFFIGTSSAPVQAKENKDFGTGLTIRRIFSRVQESTLPQNRSTKVNIILRDTRTISTASVRTLWQMHCKMPAMILWNWWKKILMHILRITT